jgi:hypothetical protein
MDAFGTHMNFARVRNRTMAEFVIVALLLTVASLFVVVPAAEATAPNGVSFTLEGCRNPALSSYNPTIGDLVCNTADYTTGNLGKSWNELDLVPYRITTKAGNSAPSSQAYDVAIVVDQTDGARPGYDVLSVPVLNTSTALSDPGCLPLSADPAAGVGATQDPGIGGTDQSLYRVLTITQPKNTECTYDYWARLAVGSHLFPGASLHANLTNEALGTAGIGAKDVSIPVKEIEPQDLEKNMAATQGSDHVWNVTKNATPSVNFGNTCDTQTATASVQVDISWTKSAGAPSGQVALTTNITAINPSHRTIRVDIEDKIYAGSGQTDLVDTGNFPDVDVPANDSITVTHTVNVSSSASSFNDVATATYEDLLTGVPIPGTTQATASAAVTSSGQVANDSATIVEQEVISGAGLSFSVDSQSGTAGTFTLPGGGAYTLGTPTTQTVTWSPPTQTSSGSVSFTKSLYLADAQAASGTLSDVVTLTTSGSLIHTANASTNISGSPLVDLTIVKTIPNVLQSGETASFTFDVKLDGQTIVASPTINFTAGQTSNSTSALTDGAPGSYTVEEQTQTGWAPQSSQVVDLTPPPAGQCSAEVTFNNSLGPATAKARKVTNPVGQEAGWVFQLYQVNGGQTLIATQTTSGTGFVTLSSTLEEGNYKIVETLKSGWFQNDGSLHKVNADQTTAFATECSFSVNFPADSSEVYECTFNNTKQGTVTLIKTSSGQSPSAGAFTFEIREGASATELGTVVDADTNDANGLVDFDGANPLDPGNYQICETSMLPGWLSTLSSQTGAFVPDSDDPNHDNSVICVPFTLDPGEDEVFNVDNTPPPGGDARTIGYWKNWSGSCTGGHQTDTLGTTLASFGGGGVLIGDIFVNQACAEAVPILSKSRLSGTKMANDAAYGLAAQLLAAKLNVQAGAGTCAAATTAITNGQALLDTINFDATGSYLGPKVKGATAVQRANALSLATTLNDYNNNTLC